MREVLFDAVAFIVLMLLAAGSIWDGHVLTGYLCGAFAAVHLAELLKFWWCFLNEHRRCEDDAGD